MNKRRTILTCVILLLITVLSACVPVEQDQLSLHNADLMDNKWVLISLSGNAPIEGKDITLVFQEAVIEGSGGCNTYGGSYTVSDDSLNLSDVYWTEMGCMEPEGILEQEQTYFQALDAAVRYRVDGDRLEVYDETEAQILIFAASSSETLAVEGMPPVITEELSLDCSIEMDQSYSVGESVDIRFVLRNQTGRPLYILSWYTPLEGIAGEIFQVTRDGEKLPYEGMLIKRGDPTREAYVLLEPGNDVSALVNLRTGYDLSTPGSYKVQFATDLQDVSDDASLIPRKRDDHRPQSLSCNTVDFSIVPASEQPTATPVAAESPTPEPPAGFRRYVNGPSDVSLWVPGSWTVIEPGPHSPILQSYPQDKYVGGEPRQSGDTKCDLNIRQQGEGINDLIQQWKSNDMTTILLEEEILLQSGKSGIRVELDSMGRSNALVTEINGRVIVLTCFGDFTQFDEIAVTLSAVD